jgi:hypothetical protein
MVDMRILIRDELTKSISEPSKKKRYQILSRIDRYIDQDDVKELVTLMEISENTFTWGPYHENIYSKVVDKLIAKLPDIKLGYPKCFKKLIF